MMTVGDRYLASSSRRYFSFVNYLRKQGRINELIETAISNMTLEELIAVKLELSTKTLRSPIYQLPLWDALDIIVREAMIKFAVAVSNTPSEAAASLGIDLRTLRSNMKQFNMLDYVSSRWRDTIEKRRSNRAKRAARKAEQAS